MASVQRGFTLTELAVVLAIVGLLLGSMMLTFSSQVEQRNFAETQRRLEQAKELLIGFAIVNGRLPCPAWTANGDESPVGGSSPGSPCTNPYNGFLPGRAIGFLPVDKDGYALDAWNNRIRYAVAMTVKTSTTCPDVAPKIPPLLAGDTYWTSPFTTATATTVPNSPTFLKANGLACQTGDSDLVVRTECQAGAPACPSPQPVTNQNTVVAIVFSIGKNRIDTVGAAGANEAENLNSDAVFVSRTPDSSDAVGGEYDDLMTWIPVGLLYERLTAAGVLP